MISIPYHWHTPILSTTRNHRFAGSETSDQDRISSKQPSASRCCPLRRELLDSDLSSSRSCKGTGYTNLFALQAPATSASWRWAPPELCHHYLRLANRPALSTLDAYVSCSTSDLDQEIVVFTLMVKMRETHWISTSRNSHVSHVGLNWLKCESHVGSSGGFSGNCLFFPKGIDIVI